MRWIGGKRMINKSEKQIAEEVFREFIVPLYPKDKPLSEMTSYEKGEYKRMRMICSHVSIYWKIWMIDELEAIKTIDNEKGITQLISKIRTLEKHD